MIFKVSTFEKNNKINPKTHQNEDAKKAFQKPLQKSISGATLASQNLQKSKKNRIENDVEKRCGKKHGKNPPRPSKKIHRPRIRGDPGPTLPRTPSLYTYI